MTEPVVSVMMTDLRDTIRAAFPDMQNRITYGPPEMAPAALSIWLEYTLLDQEMGLLDVCLHQAIATVAVPRKGQYPTEYAKVTDVQQAVRQAVRANPYYATDATLVGIESQPAGGSGYAGIADALVAGRLIFTFETKTEILTIP